MTLNLNRVECKVADPCGHCLSRTPHRPVLAVYDPGSGSYAEAGPDVCTARWATGNARHAEGDPCGAPATEQIGDSPVCRHHYDRAMEWFYKRRIELPGEHQREYEEALRKAAEVSRRAAEARSIVYFLRREDSMIKIGVTGDYKNRLKSLQSEHGKLRLLLAYAGTRKEEREAHRHYARERIHYRSEWFRPELRLLLDIQRLRNAWHGQPSSLPEQVPVAEIRALIKAVRQQQAA